MSAEEIETTPEVDMRPEAPTGYRILDCWADPKHPGLYMIDDEPEDNGYYHPPCFYCMDSENRRERDKEQHKKHRAFWRSKAGRWIISYAYSLGIISGSGRGWGGAGECNGCLTFVSWKGSRPYVLGMMATEWGCILKRHHWPTEDKIAFGMCSKCLPCDVCGSSEAWHRCNS